MISMPPTDCQSGSSRPPPATAQYGGHATPVHSSYVGADLIYRQKQSVGVAPSTVSTVWSSQQSSFSLSPHYSSSTVRIIQQPSTVTQSTTKYPDIRVGGVGSGPQAGPQAALLPPSSSMIPTPLAVKRPIYPGSPIYYPPLASLAPTSSPTQSSSPLAPYAQQSPRDAVRSRSVVTSTTSSVNLTTSPFIRSPASMGSGTNSAPQPSMATGPNTWRGTWWTVGAPVRAFTSRSTVDACDRRSSSSSSEVVITSTNVPPPAVPANMCSPQALLEANTRTIAMPGREIIHCPYNALKITLSHPLWLPQATTMESDKNELGDIFLLKVQHGREGMTFVVDSSKLETDGTHPLRICAITFPLEPTSLCRVTASKIAESSNAIGSIDIDAYRMITNRVRSVEGRVSVGSSGTELSLQCFIEMLTLSSPEELGGLAAAMQLKNGSKQPVTAAATVSAFSQPPAALLDVRRLVGKPGSTPTVASAVSLHGLQPEVTVGPGVRRLGVTPSVPLLSVTEAEEEEDEGDLEEDEEVAEEAGQEESDRADSLNEQLTRENDDEGTEVSASLTAVAPGQRSTGTADTLSVSATGNTPAPETSPAEEDALADPYPGMLAQGEENMPVTQSTINRRRLRRPESLWNAVTEEPETPAPAGGDGESAATHSTIDDEAAE